MLFCLTIKMPQKGTNSRNRCRCPVKWLCLLRWVMAKTSKSKELSYLKKVTTLWELWNRNQLYKFTYQFTYQYPAFKMRASANWAGCGSSYKWLFEELQLLVPLCFCLLLFFIILRLNPRWLLLQRELFFLRCTVKTVQNIPTQTTDKVNKRTRWNSKSGFNFNSK